MQPSLINWQAVEGSSDILRFRTALDGLDDDALIAELELQRKGRRDDYPLHALWNAMLAGLFFDHATIAGLIRELRRNAELRQACGFDPVRGEGAIPGAHVFSRLLGKLAARPELLQRVFAGQVERLAAQLPDLGTHLAADGKAIVSRGRSDPEAAQGTKSQPGADGKTRIMNWFGYKLHLICDAVHELPLAFEVTAANVNESPCLIPMVQTLAQAHPQLAERSRTLAADMGYDDGADKAELWDGHGIAPLIPARDLNRGVHQPLDPERHDTVYVSPTGQVCCKIDPLAERPEAQFCPMQFQGFEADRATLKFRCPAAALGVTCKNQAACAGATKDQGFGRSIRVPLGRDRRLHLPVYPHGRAFEDGYKRRTSIERLFYRLDHLYGFERHALRGRAKVAVRVTMALIAMLATAVGCIEQGRAQEMRSRFQAA